MPCRIDLTSRINNLVVMIDLIIAFHQWYALLSIERIYCIIDCHISFNGLLSIHYQILTENILKYLRLLNLNINKSLFNCCQNNAIDSNTANAMHFKHISNFKHLSLHSIYLFQTMHAITIAQVLRKWNDEETNIKSII